LAVTAERQQAVDPELHANIAAVQRLVFPLHGLPVGP
jgi:hypothetical protein